MGRGDAPSASFGQRLCQQSGSKTAGQSGDGEALEEVWQTQICEKPKAFANHGNQQPPAEANLAVKAINNLSLT